MTYRPDVAFAPVVSSQPMIHKDSIESAQRSAFSSLTDVVHHEVGAPGIVPNT